MPKTQTTLKFRLSGGAGASVDISGRIETFEAPLFVKEPAVDISILCFDPDFRDPVSTVVSGSTTSGQIPSTVPYLGTVETGFTLVLNPNRPLTAFNIYHSSPDGVLNAMDFGYQLLTNDVLTISTLQGAKRVTLKRANVTTSVLYALSPQSNWLELQPGNNSFRVYAEGLSIPYTVEYVAKYGGL